MGFWDVLDNVLGYIPVAGTIKDGVEAAVLEAQGKHDAAKEKALEAAIDLAGDIVTVATLGSGYEVAAAGKAAAEAAMKEMAESGAKGVAKEAMLKATKAGFSLKAATAIAAAATAAHGKAQLKQQIHGKEREREKPRPPRPRPDEPKKPSKRGEHVINNGVRKALPKIINRFLLDNPGSFDDTNFEQLVAQGCITPEMSVYASHEQPLPTYIDERIQHMSVYVPSGEQHFDPNDVLYGEAMSALTVCIISYMKHLFKVLVEDEKQRSHLDRHYRSMAIAITKEIDKLNTPGAELYVDRQALGWWLAIRGNDVADYREARNHVAEMFTNLSPLRRTTGNTVTWVLELFQAYERLNRTRSLVAVAGGMLSRGAVKKSNRIGGNGGSPFDDITAHDPPVIGIRAIRIRHGDQVDSIQATYILATGSTVVGGHHGGWGGKETYLQLEAGEEIVEVYGKTACTHVLHVVDQITFKTQKADGTRQTYGPFGKTGRTSYSVKGLILGFYGRSCDLLDSVGFYHIPSVAGGMLSRGAVKKSNRIGGNGGSPFDDNITAHDPPVIGIRAIRIRHGDQVDSIQATYILATGSTFVGGHHGRWGGKETYLQLEAGEEIVEVYGKTACTHALHVVDQITFKTQKADGTRKTYGPFGKTGRTSYSVKGLILGFYGRSGDLLDSVGFYHIPWDLYCPVAFDRLT